MGGTAPHPHGAYSLGARGAPCEPCVSGPYVRSIGTHAGRDDSLAILGDNARRRRGRRRWWHRQGQPPQASGQRLHTVATQCTQLANFGSLLLLHGRRLGELHLARVGAAGRAHLGDRALARLGVHDGRSAGHSVCLLVHLSEAPAPWAVSKTGPKGALLCYGIANTPDPSSFLRGVLARCTAMALHTYPCGGRHGSRSSPQCSRRHQRHGAHHPCCGLVTVGPTYIVVCVRAPLTVRGDTFCLRVVTTTPRPSAGVMPIALSLTMPECCGQRRAAYLVAVERGQVAGLTREHAAEALLLHEEAVRLAHKKPLEVLRRHGNNGRVG